MKIVMYDKDNKIVVKECQKIEFSFIKACLVVDEDWTVKIPDVIRIIS